ncbi:MAG: hypothetical protein WCK61_03345 [Candidatus Omnitrophota bacterium]
MKNIFKKLFGSIVNFFNRMVDQEAERAIEIYRQIYEVKTEKGGLRK